jgi:hypothetical protein
MDHEDDWTPLHLPLLLFSAVAFTVLCYWHGSEANWPNSSATLPMPIHLIADGIERVPRYWFAVAGFLVAIGASLGRVSIRQSVMKCALGSLAAIGPTLGATSWAYLATAGELTNGIADTGTIGLATAVAVLIAFAVGAATALLVTWMPVAITAIAAAIIIHAFHRMLHDEPMPWQPQRDEDEVDSMRVASDLGTIAAVFVALAAAYDFVPGFTMLHIKSSEPTTIEGIWEKLPTGDPEKPLLSTQKGRGRIETDILDMRNYAQWAANEPCTLQYKTSLENAVNSYFKKIRRYENWAPGKPLSSHSQKVRAIAISALENNRLGWEDLKPYTRMHLDAVKYSAFSYSYPLSCP